MQHELLLSKQHPQLDCCSGYFAVNWSKSLLQHRSSWLLWWMTIFQVSTRCQHLNCWTHCIGAFLATRCRDLCKTLMQAFMASHHYTKTSLQCISSDIINSSMNWTFLKEDCRSNTKLTKSSALLRTARWMRFHNTSCKNIRQMWWPWWISRPNQFFSENQQIAQFHCPNLQNACVMVVEAIFLQEASWPTNFSIFAKLSNKYAKQRPDWKTWNRTQLFEFLQSALHAVRKKAQSAQCLLVGAQKRQVQANSQATGEHWYRLRIVQIVHWIRSNTEQKQVHLKILEFSWRSRYTSV